MAGKFDNIVFRATFFLIGLVLLTSCASSKKTGDGRFHAPSRTSEQSRKQPSKTSPSATQLEIKSISTNDVEIEAILDLAKEGNWDEAEIRAMALAKKAPGDASVIRTATWVSKQRQLHRDQALEDRIRKIEAKDSVFNPTVPSLLSEEKDRGLPPRKDLRDAISQLEAIPYVPESFGKTVVEKGRLFDPETKEGKMAKILDKEISAHLDNVTLEAVIFNIGQAEGINFVADTSLPAFKQKLSVNMDKVKLSEFLRYISRNLDVQFQVGDDLIWIVDSKDPKRVLEETRFYRLRKGFITPAQFDGTDVNRTTLVQRLPTGVVTNITENQTFEKFVKDGAPVTPSIELAIQKFFTGPKYMIDFERNIIVATGTHEQLAVMDKIVEEFDRPVQQVLIEARFITVSQAAFMELGAQWETGRSPLTVGRLATDFTGLASGGVGLGLQTTFTNILGRDDLSVTLKALEQGGESQTLSAPRLTLINNLPAHIEDGKVQYYYEEYSVKQQVTDRATASSLVPTGKPVNLTSGASLDVVASIGGDGKSILLALKPEVKQDVELVTFATVTDRNEAGEVSSSFDIKLPEYRTQSLSTRVMVKSGQTVVMGGVMEHVQSTFVESVPILGNIPIIGAAFRKRTEVDNPRYLLIFVTATLLSESGEFIEFTGE
jgi:type IV pilus assembly protein PilQ